MQTLIGNTKLQLVQGDITDQDVDAVVNAANEALFPGGGVSGAIHRAGGGRIWAECEKIGICPEGEAVITTGGNLKAGHVIHSVGPVYEDGQSGEAEVLSHCYSNSLRVAVENDLKSIAFPSISTGIYDYPVDEAARVALSSVLSFLEGQRHKLQLVRFVLFDANTLAAYEAVRQKLSAEKRI